MWPRRHHKAGRGSRVRLLAPIALVLLLAFPARALAGDNANDPLPIPVGKVTGGTNTGSTDEPGEPLTAGGPLSCQGRKMSRTRWYSVIGTGGKIVVDTGGSNFATLLGLYTPAQPPSPASFLGCAQGSLTFASVPGAEYRVQLGGLCSPACASGAHRIRVNAVPANDDMAGAETANCCYNLGSRNLRWASTEPGELASCKGEAIDHTIWFRWIAPETGRVTFSTGTRRTLGAFDEASRARINCSVTPLLRVDVRKGQSVLVQVGRSPDASTYVAGFASQFVEDHDLDNDGYAPPTDCNDRNARVNPDAVDVPRDGVDRNCDGTDRPGLVRGVIQLYANLAGKGQPILGVSRLHVEKARRGSKVTVKCSGRSCRRKRWTRKVRGKAVDFKRPLKRSPRKFKATFVVMVTRGSDRSREPLRRALRRREAHATEPLPAPGRQPAAPVQEVSAERGAAPCSPSCWGWLLRGRVRGGPGDEAGGRGAGRGRDAGQGQRSAREREDVVAEHEPRALSLPAPAPAAQADPDRHRGADRPPDRRADGRADGRARTGTRADGRGPVLSGYE